MPNVRSYIDSLGRSTFDAWFNSLNVTAAAKVTVALERMAIGHTALMRSVGGGVFEYKIDFGPGYRIYFGRDGHRLIILVGGGTKKRQQLDIEYAKLAWKDYKLRKMEEK